MKNSCAANPNSLLRPAIPLTLAAMTLLLLASVSPARADQGQDNRAPDVPAALEVPAGNKVEYHAYAIGVQIYRWSGSSWVFQAPEAMLFDADGNVVGLHYAGPTWESNSGSKVVGARIAGVTVDSTAIPWLLLGAVATDGNGILANTTYIQRVNTVGGKAPATAGTSVGQVASVPYTAEYYFFRAD